MYTEQPNDRRKRFCYVYIDTATTHSNENKRTQNFNLYKTTSTKTISNKRMNFTHEKSVSDERTFIFDRQPEERGNRTGLRLFNGIIIIIIFVNFRYY